MAKVKYLKFNDDYGLEADCLLTTIIYKRIEQPLSKCILLQERVNYLDRKIRQGKI